MLTIQCFKVNMLEENCYVVSDDSKECMIVDCGAFYPEEVEAISQYITDNGLTPVLQVLTHAHYDHIFGVKAIYDRYGVKPVLSVHDEKMYLNAKEYVKNLMGIDLDLQTAPLGRLVRHGDTVKFGDTEFRVIETPGHTPGCVFYYSEKEKTAFSGDTLFRGSIGRTDLPGGSMFQIIQSLRMMTQYPDDTRILPGHGEETTLGYELATNMYLDR